MAYYHVFVLLAAFVLNVYGQGQQQVAQSNPAAEILQGKLGANPVVGHQVPADVAPVNSIPTVGPLSGIVQDPTVGPFAQESFVNQPYPFAGPSPAKSVAAGLPAAISARSFGGASPVVGKNIASPYYGYNPSAFNYPASHSYYPSQYNAAITPYSAAFNAPNSAAFNSAFNSAFNAPNSAAFNAAFNAPNSAAFNAAFNTPNSAAYNAAFNTPYSAAFNAPYSTSFNAPHSAAFTAASYPAVATPYSSVATPYSAALSAPYSSSVLPASASVPYPYSSPSYNAYNNGYNSAYNYGLGGASYAPSAFDSQAIVKDAKK